MKKNYLLIAAGLFCALTMQAQKRIVASVGFEVDDASYQSQFPLTALDVRPAHWDDNNTNQNGSQLGFIHGDWVNYKAEDEWTELCEDDPHSGDYCFQAINGGSRLYNTWDRGFKLRLDGVQELTPYRVSFWVKADPETTYSIKPDGTTVQDGETTEATKLTSWFSQGTEELDKSIPNYGLDQSKELLTGKTMTFTGDWQRVVYQVFVCPKSDIDATRQSWQGNSTFPAAYGGEGETYWEHFQQHFPDMYFFIANMFYPTTYYLDDILVEENVTVKEVTYSDEIIKVDFGYPTNMGNLASGNKGTVTFDPSCVTVTQDGEEVPVLYVEGKSDGYLYIFVDEQLYDDSEVIVSFKGDKNLLYSDASKRPTAETGDVAVFGFEDEKAYWDETVYAEAAAYGTPAMKRSVPVNNSFNLKPEEVQEVSITYTSKVQLTKNAKAVLKHGGKTTDFTEGMKLSSDALTVTVPVSGLEDGAYTLVVTGLKNETGTETANDAEVSFEIGEVQGETSAQVVYQSDYTIAGSNVPYGFSGYGKGAWQKSTREAPYSGNQSAPRLMSSGDSKGIYMCARPEGDKVSLEFGKYAAVAAAENGGTITNLYDAETNPTGIDPATEALYLEPGDYLLRFVMPAWDVTRTAKVFKSGIYSVNIDNTQDDPYVDVPVADAVWEEPAPHSVIGDVGVFNTNDLTSEDVTTHEFTITEPGYYYVKFTGTDLGYEAWLLVSLAVSAKPSSTGAYVLAQLKEDIEKAEEMFNTTDEKYNGTAKNALQATIQEAKETRFTNEEEVNAMAKKLTAAKQALTDRMTNYDNYVKAYESAVTALEGLTDKYKTNERLKGNLKEAQDIVEKYQDVNPTNYSDEELAAAITDVNNVNTILNGIKSVVDVLTYRATQASNLAKKLMLVEEDVIAALDALSNDAPGTIDAANKHNTLALYQLIASEYPLDELMEKVWSTETYPDEDIENDPNYDDQGHKLLRSGINLTGYINNPNFYTTRADENIADDTFYAWLCTQYTEDHVTYQDTGITGSEFVKDSRLISIGATVDYDLYQVLTDLPVGVYTVELGSRLATYDYDYDGDGKAETNEYNGFDENTGLWDKYVYAQVDDTKLDDTNTTKFSRGGYGSPQPTYVYNVVVKEGQKLRIGAVEHYTSGKAMKNGEATSFWDTTTFVDNARIYFSAPLEGYDYAAAAQKLENEIATEIKTVDAAPAQQNNVIVNLAGQQVDENYKGIVIKNGVKYLQK